MNNILKAFLIALLVVFGLAAALTLLAVSPDLSRAMANAANDNTAENECLRQNGSYSFTGFGGEHRCYINGYRHDVYLNNDNIWKVTKQDVSTRKEE